MPEQVDEQAILRQAIDDLNPQVPIRSWRREDNLLVLHLADGRTIHYDWHEGAAANSAQTLIPEGNLAGHLKSDLQMVAQALGVDGWRDMLKADLIEALEALRDA